jgi:HEAT repeat protein
MKIIRLVFFAASILFGVIGGVSAQDINAGSDPEFTKSVKQEISNLRRKSNKASDRITKMGPAAIPFLVEALKEKPESYDFEQKLAEAIGNMGTDALKPLINMLIDADIGLTMNLTNSISMMGEAAIPTLCTELNNEFENVREAAASSLGKIKSRKASQCLVNAFSKASSDVKAAAGEIHEISSALEKIADPEVVPALINALTSKNEYVPWNAARALGAIGPKAKAAVPSLIHGLEDKAIAIKWPYADALGSIGDPIAIPVLVRMLKEALEAGQNSDDQSFARSLGMFGAKAESAIPVLIKSISSNSGLRFVASEALIKIGEASIAPLTKALDSSAETARESAASALGEFGQKAEIAIPRLSQMAKSENETPAVRKAAGSSLHKIIY